MPELPATPDPVQAEMWLGLAATDNLDFYGNELRVAEGQMTAEQIAQGKALAESWKPKVGLRPSSTHAKRRDALSLFMNPG